MDSEIKARRRWNRVKNTSAIRIICIFKKDKKNGKILRMLRRHLQRMSMKNDEISML